MIFLSTLAAFFATTLNVNSSFDSQLVSREIVVAGGRKLVSQTLKVGDEAPWLVYMPGSGDRLSPLSKRGFLKALLPQHKYNLLVINKVGIELNGKVSSQLDFQKGSIRSQRIADTLSAMKQLLPAEARVLLIALSEGAYIAPEVAEADNRVRALILLSGNSWSWLEEEVRCLPQEKQTELRIFLENTVVPNPVFDKYYGKFWSYAYFDSYNTDATYRALARSSLPILALHGSQDEVLWLDGALQHLEQLVVNEGKTNIERHLIEGANHSLGCPEKSETSCDPVAIQQRLSTLLLNFSDRFN